MSTFSEEQQIKNLRKQCFKLTEQLAQSMQRESMYKQYQNLFILTKEGFCKMREQYRELQRERPELPTWEELVKLAGQRGQKVLGGLN